MALETGQIRLTEEFGLSPTEIYEILTDRKFYKSLPSRLPANYSVLISSFRGLSKFAKSLDIELVPGEKIVQKWKAAQLVWPKDHYSDLFIELSLKDGKTILTLVQDGVPSVCIGNIMQAWIDIYFAPIKNLETYLLVLKV